MNDLASRLVLTSQYLFGRLDRFLKLLMEFVFFSIALVTHCLKVTGKLQPMGCEESHSAGIDLFLWPAAEKTSKDTNWSLTTKSANTTFTKNMHGSTYK